MSQREGKGRFQHVGLDIVWAAVMSLDPGHQHELLRELATLFASEVTEVRGPKNKVRKAVCALHEAAEILGHSPTVDEYRRLAVALPELGLPPESSVRSWLGGGWHECLERALLPTAVTHNVAPAAVGATYPYTDEDVFEAMRQCAAELGHVPSITEYFAWARRPDVVARPGRRFLSYKPLERFGGFRKALVAAGLITAEQSLRASNGRAIPSAHAYGEAEMTRALRLVEERAGALPTQAAYTRERQRVLCAIERGEIPPLPMPTAPIIRDFFGTWQAALRSCGLDPIATRHSGRRGRRRPDYTTDEIADALRRAWTAKGEPFTSAAYAAWRREQIEQGAVETPALSTIERRFGTWTAAVAHSIPEGGNR